MMKQIFILLLFFVFVGSAVGQVRPDQQNTKTPELTDAIYTQEDGTLKKVLFSAFVDWIIDNYAQDTSLTNEIQSLTYSGDTLYLSNSNFVEILNNDSIVSDNITLSATGSINANANTITLENDIKEVFKIDNNGVKFLNTGIDNNSTNIYGKDPITSEVIEITDLSGFTGIGGAQVLNQIVYGTGSGMTTNDKFTFNGNQVGINNTTGNNYALLTLDIDTNTPSFTGIRIYKNKTGGGGYLMNFLNGADGTGYDANFAGTTSTNRIGFKSYAVGSSKLNADYVAGNLTPPDGAWHWYSGGANSRFGGPIILDNIADYVQTSVTDSTKVAIIDPNDDMLEVIKMADFGKTVTTEVASNYTQVYRNEVIIINAIAAARTVTLSPDIMLDGDIVTVMVLNDAIGCNEIGNTVTINGTIRIIASGAQSTQSATNVNLACSVHRFRKNGVTGNFDKWQ